MHRNTYVEVNLKNIEENIESIIENNDSYKYYFGVVKADSYGHYDIKTVKSIIKGGCNYLAVATLDEALEIRKFNKEIPILCLGIIPRKYLKLSMKNNITVTISNQEYIKNIDFNELVGLKVHIKINTGMNRLGFDKKSEFEFVYNELLKNQIEIEGIYTHIYNSCDKEDTEKQIQKFKKITDGIDISTIQIIHIFASDALIRFPKLDFTNGCRIGIAMYGFSNDTNLKLNSTFSLKSEVIQINEVEDGTVGYDGAYKVNGKEKIAVIPIGYADGIIRKNTGRNVFINDKAYKIVGNICMDMLFVKVDESVKINDTVILIKDVEHIYKISKHLETIPYEVLCSISKRVPRKYIYEKK